MCALDWLQATGVTFRAAVFPLFVYQIKATQRLMQAKPDFSKLYSAYKYARTFLVRLAADAIALYHNCSTNQPSHLCLWALT